MKCGQPQSLLPSGLPRRTARIDECYGSTLQISRFPMELHLVLQNQYVLSFEHLRQLRETKW